VLGGPDESVNAEAAFSADGRRVLVYGVGARVWDAITGRPLTPVFRRHQGVAHGEISPDGRYVLTCSPLPEMDPRPLWESVSLWDAATGQPVPLTRMPTGPVRASRFSPDGGRLLLAFDKKGASVWDLATRQPLYPPLPHPGSVSGAWFSPDGRRLLTVGDRIARVWDATTGQPISPAIGPLDRIHSRGFSPDGGRVLTIRNRSEKGGKIPGEVRLWDATTGQPLTPPLPHLDENQEPAFSPDGSRLLTRAEKDKVRVWDATTGRPLTEPLPHDSDKWAARFSPDGRLALTATKEDTVRVWDAATGQPLTPPLPHRPSADSLRDLAHGWEPAFSPDGRRLLTAADIETARVWDAATGRAVGPPLGYKQNLKLAQFFDTSPLSFATFSPDGQSVLTVTAVYSETQLWDASTGRPLNPLQVLGLGHELTYVGFSPDGRRLLTAGAGTWARLWDVSADERPADDLVLRAKLLTGLQLDGAGNLERCPPEECRRARDLLRRKYPADFAPPSAEDLRTWHNDQAEAAERFQEWFAAKWHLERLLHADPRQESLVRRRDKANAELLRLEKEREQKKPADKPKG
jgi:WD40 repeat protein